MMDLKYGLIGERLGHSFSKEVHSLLGNNKYRLCELNPNEVSDFIRSKQFNAINVTIPYKESVIPHLDFISDEAKAIGSVNTVVNNNGKLYGYNTDFLGMCALIKKAEVDISGKKVLILGSGGTSKTANAVCRHLHAGKVITVSRKKSNTSISYDEMYTDHTDADVIINTTPVGMYPNNDDISADISKFPYLNGVIDVIYNPIRTNLILNARSRGIKAEGGLYMLVAQAIYASEYFFGKKYPADVFDNVYNSILRSKENIVLIGMPGCGKTTVGRLLSDRCKKSFVDTDDLITDHAKKSIPLIFSEDGEKAFRDIESSEIATCSLQNNMIISTGGGAILRDQNVRRLKQNGKLYFIDRPIEHLIPTSDRPLANDELAMKKRYEERYSIYIGSADTVIKADGSPTDVCNKIAGDFYK